MINYKIDIVSVQDRDYLVAEIWIDGELFAEINQEREKINIQFYPFKENSFPFDEIVNIIFEAKKILLE
ncbi:MAG: hypothetical protein RO257_03935 [Candidatus Kapabacteria bacterium]|nr:hypothetical protein [Candidatus Kapabacteria bacterium]